MEVRSDKEFAMDTLIRIQKGAEMDQARVVDLTD